MINKSDFHTKIFNTLFILFCLSLLSVFFVNLFSHYGYGSWQVSEFLINYQGGFVRRGLMGEILFFFAKYFDYNVEWAIKIICSVSLFSVCAFFVRAFLKKGYTLYLLPLCFFCSGPLMYDAWIKKDYLMLLFFIAVTLIYTQKKAPLFLKFLFINLLSVFIILTHEVFALFTLPILFFLFLHDFRNEQKCIFTSIVQSLLVLLPSALAFIIVILNSGDMNVAQAIWNSWHIISGLEPTELTGNSIEAIGWDSLWTVKFHLKLNFLVEDNYILSIWYWIITFPLVYYITMNALLVFNTHSNIYTPKDRNILAAIWIFQFICLIPMFTILSIDYVRIFFYLSTTTFGIFLIVPKEKIQTFLPSLFYKAADKINTCFDKLFTPSKSSMAILMLIVGVSFSTFSIRTIVMSTMVYRILLLFSQPTIMIKDIIMSLF